MKLRDFKYVKRKKKRGRPSKKELQMLAVLDYYFEENKERIRAEIRKEIFDYICYGNSKEGV